jgi:hypothetical protein
VRASLLEKRLRGRDTQGLKIPVGTTLHAILR